MFQNYQCKGCGAKVAVDSGQVLRLCACPSDTGVSASVSAVMVGKSRISGEKDDARVQ